MLSERQVGPEQEPRQELEAEKYREKTEVNGIKIEVFFIDDFNGPHYEIFFPQIKMSDKASKKGVRDQVIILGEDAESAKRVFNHAAELARTEPDVYELYKKAENYWMSLRKE